MLAEHLPFKPNFGFCCERDHLCFRFAADVASELCIAAIFWGGERVGLVFNEGETCSDVLDTRPAADGASQTPLSCFWSLCVLLSQHETTAFIHVNRF